MRLRVGCVLPLLLLLFAAGPSSAQLLRVWGSDDPTEVGNEPTDDPGDPWVESDGNNVIPVDLPIGGELWLASLNDQDPQRNKFWAIRLEGPLAEEFLFQTIVGGEAFEGFQTDTDLVPVDGGLVGFGLLPQQRDWKFRFTPQPRWERLALRAPDGATGDLTVKANSVCTDMRVAFVDLSLEDTSFGAPGAMRSETPLVTEFWVFPRQSPADPEQPPTFVAPPHTGIWTSEFVSVDPEGVTRPLGVKFSTDGPGLAPIDRVDAGFRMAGPAGTTFDAWSFAPSDGEYVPYVLQAPSPVPAAPGWGLALLALALGGAGAWQLRRRGR